MKVLESCQKYDESTAHLENTANGLGYIPLVSTFTGTVRSICGTVQALFGALGALFRGGQYVITRNPDHLLLAKANRDAIEHGAMNELRGNIESIPVAGNLATFVYDNVIGLRYNYTYEKLNGKDPLNLHYKHFERLTPPKELPLFQKNVFCSSCCIIAKAQVNAWVFFYTLIWGYVPGEHLMQSVIWQQ